MSGQSAGGINQSVRYSDPLTERGGWIGRGAVLYDTRDAAHRTCCAKDLQRHLYHVTAIYEEIETGKVLIEVQDGTHTVRETIHLDDVLSLFEPAGFRIPVGTKPTYVLTRQHGVEDGHDLMTDGGRSSGNIDRTVPVDGELEEAVSWVERELREARRALWDGKSGKAFASIEAAQDEFETVEEAILDVQ